MDDEAPKILLLSTKIRLPQQNLPQTTGIKALAKESLMQSTLLWMESLSPSSVNNFQMASVSPFPTSQGWYHFMWVQISGHSSVQSSSTFGSRKAWKPIYILSLRRLNRGSCCTPKFSLPYFSKHCKKDLQVAQGCSRVGQISYLLWQSTPN